MQRLSKDCVRCGREITWRKKWAKDWASIKYCSAACRRKKLRTVDEQLERALLVLLEHQDRVNPQDVVVQLKLPDDSEHREAARMAARRLVVQGVAQLWQDGRRVDPSYARGDVELRRI